MKLFPKYLLVLIIYTAYVGDTQPDNVNVFRLLLPLHLIHPSECLLKLHEDISRLSYSWRSQLLLSAVFLSLLPAFTFALSLSLCAGLCPPLMVVSRLGPRGLDSAVWAAYTTVFIPLSSGLFSSRALHFFLWVSETRTTRKIMFVMVSCFQWLFSLRSLISHVAMNRLSVNFPHVLCSIWGVWVIWDALRGTAARVPRVASAWFLLCWCDSLSAPRLSKQRGFSLSTAHRTNTRHKASPYFSFTHPL